THNNCNHHPPCGASCLQHGGECIFTTYAAVFRLPASMGLGATYNYELCLDLSTCLRHSSGCKLSCGFGSLSVQMAQVFRSRNPPLNRRLQ
ncbi:hypothetical protein CH063_09813, partial [Colletotrichum higginsianum]